MRDDLDFADLYAQRSILDLLKQTRWLLVCIWVRRDAATWGPRQSEAFARALEAMGELIALFSRES
jgi:hypothetical protein